MFLNELMYGKVVNHPILSGECPVTLLMEGAVEVFSTTTYTLREL